MSAQPAGKYPASLAEALAMFQASLPKIVKGETGKIPGKDGKQGYSYDYADLADVNGVVMPRLGELGLSFTSRPTMQDGEFGLFYTLKHVSGEHDDGFFPIPKAASPQQIGSWVTYARRYCLCAQTGVSPDKDDDAAAAEVGHHQQSAADAFEQAGPARSRQSAPQRQNARPAAVQAAPDPDAEIDNDAQDLADEASGCLSVTELRKVHARAANDLKLRAWIADPASGAKGQLSSYLNHRKKVLEDTDAAWNDLHKAAEAHHMEVAAVEEHVRKVSGKTVEGATAADVRKAIEALKAEAA